MDVPVVLIIFNRPKTTKLVFDQIKKAEPTELFVIADGPRKEIESDRRLCEATRDIIQVDWECDVHKNYADENLGLRTRIPSGLNWVFDQVEKAIILEDDCLPNQDFFRFCEKMLYKYDGDKRVMNITGTNFLGKWKESEQDYHFSIHGGIWGWATWRESWELYDPEMELWSQPGIKERVRDVIADDEEFYYRKKVYNKTASGKIDSWDYQWSFIRLINSGLSVVPSKNTVSNIGFGENATNTNVADAERANLPRYHLSFPLQDNSYVAPDRKYDKEWYKIDKNIVERAFYKLASKL